jgi:hypothetical protein
MATWVSLVVAAAERAQLPHVACSEWSLATHVRDSAPDSSKHSSFHSELDSSALLVERTVLWFGAAPRVDAMLGQWQFGSLGDVRRASQRICGCKHEPGTSAPSLRILHHVRMCSGLQRRQYSAPFVADVLGVAHAPRRLARAGVVVEDVPESNALVSTSSTGMKGQAAGAESALAWGPGAGCCDAGHHAAAAMAQWAAPPGAAPLRIEGGSPGPAAQAKNLGRGESRPWPRPLDGSPADSDAAAV